MQGIIYSYDVTRRETFESIQDTWMGEVEKYSNVDNAIKMIVANKVRLAQPVLGYKRAGNIPPMRESHRKNVPELLFAHDPRT